MVEKHLPAAPFPIYFLKMGADAKVMVNTVEALNEVWADFQQARADAFEDDGSGVLRLESPKLLLASAKGRFDILDRVVRLIKEVHELDYVARFHEAIADILVSELDGYPELRIRVTRRLHELNESRLIPPASAGAD